MDGGEEEAGGEGAGDLVVVVGLAVAIVVLKVKKGTKNVFICFLSLYEKL